MSTPASAGPDDAGEREDDILDGDGSKELFLADEPRRERVPCRALETVGGGAERLTGEQGPDLGIRQHGVGQQAGRDDEERDIREEQHAAPVDRVGHRAAVDGDDQQRHERGDSEQADE